MNEELKEYIIAKRNPISSCVGLSKYFIGRHRTSPVYLTLQFEREFNSKMCELEKLKEQLEASEKARKEAIEFINDPWILSDYKIGSMLHDYKTRAIKILNVDKGE